MTLRASATELSSQANHQHKETLYGSIPVFCKLYLSIHKIYADHNSSQDSLSIPCILLFNLSMSLVLTHFRFIASSAPLVFSFMLGVSEVLNECVLFVLFDIGMSMSTTYTFAPWEWHSQGD